MHIKGKEKGNYSTFTHNWFDDNPNEKYQLGIRLKNSGVMSPNCTLSKPKLTFGGHDVTFEKVTSGVRISCAGETGTLNQIEAIYNYFKPNSTYFKFGSQEIKRVDYTDGSWYLDAESDEPTNIKIGCTTGTWKEFYNILEEAKKIKKMSDGEFQVEMP